MAGYVTNSDIHLLGVIQYSLWDGGVLHGHLKVVSSAKGFTHNAGLPVRGHVRNRRAPGYFLGSSRIYAIADFSCMSANCVNWRDTISPKNSLYESNTV